MTTENYVQVKLAYDFFKSNIDSEVSISDISSAIGWKESTVRTYFHKKWKELVLTRATRGLYQVCMSKGMKLEEFGNLHSQVEMRLR